MSYNPETFHEITFLSLVCSSVTETFEMTLKHYCEMWERLSFWPHVQAYFGYFLIKAFHNVKSIIIALEVITYSLLQINYLLSFESHSHNAGQKGILEVIVYSF